MPPRSFLFACYDARNDDSTSGANAVVATKLITAKELEAMGEDARYELVRGELQPMSPVGMPHGVMLGRVSTPLFAHVDGAHLGMVYIGDVGIVLESDPDTVLAPDFAFVRGEPKTLEEISQGFFRVMPDLAGEIGSPSDSRNDLRAKAQQYLAAGVPNVWLIEYRTRTLTWITADRPERVYGIGDVLDGGDLIPGFHLAIADIFR
jgi:Uma2 family endonuclease